MMFKNKLEELSDSLQEVSAMEDGHEVIDIKYSKGIYAGYHKLTVVSPEYREELLDKTYKAIYLEIIENN